MALCGKNTGGTRQKRHFSTARTVEEGWQKTEEYKDVEFGATEEEELQVGQEKPGSEGLNRRSRDSEEGAEATSASGPQHLLDQVARDWVEEEAQHEQQQYQPKDLEDQPAVVVPDEVTNGLQGAQKPH